MFTSSLLLALKSWFPFNSVFWVLYMPSFSISSFIFEALNFSLVSFSIFPESLLTSMAVPSFLRHVQLYLDSSKHGISTCFIRSCVLFYKFPWLCFHFSWEHPLTTLFYVISRLSLFCYKPFYFCMFSSSTLPLLTYSYLIPQPLPLATFQLFMFIFSPSLTLLFLQSPSCEFCSVARLQSQLLLPLALLFFT